MAWGSDLKKAISAAKKAGVDVSGFGTYAPVCKDMDQAEKLRDQLLAVFDDYCKFIISPDPKFSKSAAEFFGNQKEFVKVGSEVFKSAESWRDVGNDVFQANKKDDKKVKAIDAIRYSPALTKILTELNPANCQLYKDQYKMGQRGLQNLIKEQEKEHKKLRNSISDIEDNKELLKAADDALKVAVAKLEQEHAAFVSGKSKDFKGDVSVEDLYQKSPAAREYDKTPGARD